MEGSGRDLMSGMIFNVVVVMKDQKMIFSAIAGSGMVAADRG